MDAELTKPAGIQKTILSAEYSISIYSILSRSASILSRTASIHASASRDEGRASSQHFFSSATSGHCNHTSGGGLTRPAGIQKTRPKKITNRQDGIIPKPRHKLICDLAGHLFADCETKINSSEYVGGCSHCNVLETEHIPWISLNQSSTGSTNEDEERLH